MLPTSHIINSKDENLELFKTPEVGTIKYFIPSKTISLVYQKIEMVFKKNIRFLVSAPVGGEQLIGTTLLAEKATISHLTREVGVNCYAFAIGRVPSVKTEKKDPIPGGTLIQNLRTEILDLFAVNHILNKKCVNLVSSDKKLSTNKKLALLLSSYQDWLNLDKIKALKSISLELDKKLGKVNPFNTFTQIYYAGSDIDYQELYRFLTEEYKISDEKMEPLKIGQLMETDGLIRIENLDKLNEENLKEYSDDFGTFLIAAFSKEGNDYHFLRLFSDGWHERFGEIVQRFEKDDLFDQGVKDFIGYFIVPVEANITDGIGRKFVLESRKI